jgi:hypothetical protein
MEMNNLTPANIFSQFKAGSEYKASIGKKGLFEQSKMNERFYVGDQWYGANVGNKPLVRHNIIRRIGEYKRAVIVSNPIAVNYSAEGVPNTMDLYNGVMDERKDIASGNITDYSEGSKEGEIALITGALSDYFKTTAERLKFDDKKDKVIKNAYITGTGILYTYWDSDISTGLYADETKKKAIKGDIACEVLNIENVVFGEPNNSDIQSQPYIDIAQRKSVADLKREAKANGISDKEISAIKEDKDYSFVSGERSESEPEDSKRAKVITRLFKKYNDDGSFSIHAVKVTQEAYIRKEWDLGITLYPIAIYSWDERQGCIYGDSEITYIIPNQIAINRVLTSWVWAQMMNGTPIMLQNGDTVVDKITNMPGEIIKVYGGEGDIRGAVSYLNPPMFTSGYRAAVNDLINTTLSCAGANDAALGNVNPNNMSALVVAREAATMPMQLHQNRFYQFCEDVARIWAEMWLKNYGKRHLKIEDESGVWYLPFDAEKYKGLILSVRVDVGASTMWGESQVISTLGNLLTSGLITPLQYLKRLPKNSIPDISGLIRDMTKKESDTAGDVETILNELGLSEEEKQEFYKLPKEEQDKILSSAFGAGKQNTGGNVNEAQSAGDNSSVI